MLEESIDREDKKMWEEQIEVSKKAAVEAGIAIMEVYESGEFDVEYKEDHSPLTRADKAANEIIVRALTEHFPTIAVLSEEEVDDKTRLQNPLCFVVDPLDGTKEFVKRNGQFTVNIALSNHHKSVMGVIYVPVTGELYYASEGLGAFMEQLDPKNPVLSGKNAERLHVSDITNPEHLRVVLSNSHCTQQEEEVLERCKFTHFSKRGSSLKGCLIAKGDAEIYFRYSPTMEWDTGAMQCVVEQAGGIFRQMDHSVMTYNRENSVNDKGFYILNCEENLLW